MKPNGVVLYEGPSAIDGAPIVAIATNLWRKSENLKTGDMVQTWILRADVAPLDAAKDGSDASVCGGCKHRPANLGTCYVALFQGPRSVYAAYKTGNYPRASLSEAADMVVGRKIRLGAYGDPCAVPLEVWRAFIARGAGHTGYTHQWRARRFEGFKDLVQASVDSPKEYETAVARGWATFRVRSGAEPVLASEHVCPASEEAGHKTDCATCLACNGTGARVVILVHGARAARFAKAS